MAGKSKQNSKRAPVRHKPVPVPAPPLFPVIGVGASAGGIDAFIDLIRHIPATAPVAIAYILHQDPKHTSSLPQVVARASKLPVKSIEDGQPIEMGHVYVAPPGSEVSVEDSVFHLHSDAGATTLPIDFFLRSLADDMGARAIGVILSGAASDGSLGARRIKGEGGITFAQDASAKFPSMPQSAISAGAVDFVLPPDRIAEELMRIAQQFPSIAAPVRLPEADLKRLFGLLKVSRDVDFAHYKPSTIERRIRRRMALHRADTLQDYLGYIREHPQELDDLYSDILIRVTGFFRDPEVFEALQQEAFPQIFDRRDADDTIRVWVPGCATGEEVYSLAIAFLESIAASGANHPVQIFGTDISESSLERARAGVFPENISAEVSPERLRRFFVRNDGGYRISKAVRDCCIFARQNVTKDPPFSRLDLISCRNVMIYLGPVLQRRVMSIFHYALRPAGFLLLGSSEAIGTHGELFDMIDRKHKIYRRKPGGHLDDVDFDSRRQRSAQPDLARQGEEPPQSSNVLREADRILLTRYAPAGVVINESLDILQFRGRTSAFLEPAPGTASFNLLKMLREGLLPDVRGAIAASRKRNASERREGAEVKNNGSTMTANIEVIPFTTAAGERLQIVLFEEEKPKEKVRRPQKSKAERTDGERLKRELDATREYLQSIIEEQEAMNEELRSANEEIQSSNEELQSTNEELETAKEELQSSNEELTTLNEELENRNSELGLLNNDLMNLFSSIEMPVLILDGGLRLRRFNPSAQRALNLVPADLGLPISELRSNLEVDHIDKLVAQVVEDLEMRSVIVKDRNGKPYSLRIRPYRTAENKIDGAVLVLVENEPRKAQA